MCLYNKKIMYYVIGGLVFLHLLCLCLSLFFIHRYIFVSFDPTVFVLLTILLGCPIIVDIVSIRTQAISRFFVRCAFTNEGVVCYGPGLGKWCVEWNKICFYGIAGWSLPYGMPIVFLSTDSSEKYDKNRFTYLTKRRVVFEVREDIMLKLRFYMPIDMINRLQASVDNKKDCFYRKIN